jgi:hypothetical protein
MLNFDTLSGKTSQDARHGKPTVRILMRKHFKYTTYVEKGNGTTVNIMLILISIL